MDICDHYIKNYEVKYREADFGRYPKGLMYGLQALDSWLYDDKAPFMHIEANDTYAFLKKMVKKTNIVKDQYMKNGMTYAFSKNFVCWYAQKSAFELGLKGIRVVSLSPGLIATPMGNLEKGSGGFLIPYSAEERMGKPEELGYALATLADERNGYLAGVDVLCDGGSTYGQKTWKTYKK